MDLVFMSSIKEYLTFQWDLAISKKAMKQIIAATTKGFHANYFYLKFQ